MIKFEAIKSNTLCTQLWNHAVVDLSQQKFRACCKTQSVHVSNEEIRELGEDLFLNHSIFKKDREQMLSGQKPARCGVCWRMEEEGEFSFRQGPEAWHRYFEPLKDRIGDFTHSSFPDNLDIQLDNYCDLKCIYCNEEFSSQWQSEKLKFGEQVQTRASTVNPELEKNFFRWFESVKMNFKRIAFLGGEPLISPIFYDYFEKILLSYQNHFPEELEFNIITNLNTSPVYLDKFIALLQKHHGQVKFNINISMEAWGDRAELIRSNVNFDRFKLNFEKLSALSPKITLSTITSVNLLCLSTLYDYLEFLIQIERKYNRELIIYPNLISNPDWLSISLAPKEFHSLYIEKCITLLKPFHRHKTYTDFLIGLENKFQFSKLEGTPLHKSFLKQIEIIGSRRNVSYKNVFNEYGYLWKERQEV